MEFSWSEEQFAKALGEAIKSYWKNRGGQSARQTIKGSKDIGRRAEVTGGKHLNQVLLLLCKVAAGAGFKTDEFFFNVGGELPGYFRPQKRWDVVITRNGRLCAAIELKSQVGSFGNNFNNRSEEAIGCSTDFWTAFREGALGTQAPWLGYLFFVGKGGGFDAPDWAENGAISSPWNLQRHFICPAVCDSMRTLGIGTKILMRVPDSFVAREERGF